MEIVAIIAVAAAIGIHLWWRHRYRKQEAKTRVELTRFQAEVERAGEQSHARLVAIFNNVVEGVLLLDAEGRIELANRAFAAVFPNPAGFAGQTVLEAVRSHELAEFIDELARGSQVLTREIRLFQPAERWFEVNGAVILSPEGQRQGTIIVLHEVTRLKELENTRKEFVANVSHELRTPLTLIKGYCETLLDGAHSDPQNLRKFLEAIERNSKRLEFIIEDLLTISELEAGRVAVQLEPVALRQLAEKALAEIAPAAKAKLTRMTNVVPDLLVSGDATRLDQVFINLLENAVKYGRAGGAVEISARVMDNQEVEVCVSDDGPGIPVESLERVFERFYRVDKARSREQGGTGLGLAIVKHIVLSHKGRVWARSEPGEGARFYFTLLLAKQKPAPPAS